MVDDTKDSSDNKEEDTTAIQRRERGPSIFGISLRDVTLANSALTVGLVGGLAYIAYKLFIEKPTTGTGETYSQADMEKERQIHYNEMQKLRTQSPVGGGVPQIDQPLINMVPHESDYSRQVEPPANQPNPDYRYEQPSPQQQELYADNGMINMSTLQQQGQVQQPNINMQRSQGIPSIPNLNSDRKYMRDMSFD